MRGSLALIACLLTTLPALRAAPNAPDTAAAPTTAPASEIFDLTQPPGLQARPLPERPAGKSESLLTLIDAEAARLHEYALGDGVLITHGHEAAHMTLPYAPGPEYDLDADVVRISGKNAIALSFPIGRSSCTLCVGSGGNRDA